MTLKDTSLLAYLQILPQLGQRQATVYQAVIESPDSTAQELARYLGVKDPNYVRPRIHELYEQGLICDTGIRVCTVTGKKAHTWRVKQ